MTTFVVVKVTKLLPPSINVFIISSIIGTLSIIVPVGRMKVALTGVAVPRVATALCSTYGCTVAAVGRCRCWSLADGACCVLRRCCRLTSPICHAVVRFVACFACEMGWRWRAVSVVGLAAVGSYCCCLRELLPPPPSLVACAAAAARCSAVVVCCRCRLCCCCCVAVAAVSRLDDHFAAASKPKLLSKMGGGRLTFFGEGAATLCCYAAVGRCSAATALL